MARKFFSGFTVRKFGILLLSLAVALPWATGAMCETAPNPGEGGKTAPYGSLPLSFIPNQGQFDAAVAFAVQGRDKSIFFTREGLTFLLAEAESAFPPRSLRRVEPAAGDSAPVTRGWVLKLDFLGARPDARPESLEKTGGVFSYFRGRPRDWVTGVQASSSIIYRDIWPGIDLLFSGTASRMKHDFIVRPGADPSNIRLAWRGADEVRTTAGGRLEIITPLGAFQDDMPVAWQDVDGKRVEVRAAYALDGAADVQVASLQGPSHVRRPAAKGGAHAYGFQLGAYDPSKPLILDPAVLVYSGFLGATASSDSGTAIAVDRGGNAYVTGHTHSDGSGFPTAVGPCTSPGGYFDAFVAKLNKSGTRLIYCGFIGGSGHDYGKGIAVDSAGNAYVTGDTRSSQATFPVAVGPSLTFGGQDDVFVAKVNAAGTALDYCGYLGGISGESGRGIAVDAEGQAYVTGYVFSSAFPTVGGPGLSYSGAGDAFVAKVSADGASLVYSGYIGGTGQEWGNGITVDAQGQAYVTGWTDSVDFPPYQAASGEDYFIVKVAADGSSLAYSVLSNLTGFDRGLGIALDGQGQAYITGYLGADENARNAIVQKHGASGAVSGSYGGIIGGSLLDQGNGIALDRQGQAWVIGTTGSSDFPVVDSGGDCSVLAGTNAFVVKMNAAGNNYIQSGCIGGSDDDRGTGIALDQFGNAYLVGTTGSADFPVKAGPSLTHAGNDDAFVARFGDLDMPSPSLMLQLLR